MTSLYTLGEAIRTEMAEITGAVAQAHLSMRESIADFLTIQVYPFSGEGALHSRTDRTTFGAGLVLEGWVFHVDVYARQRSEIGEDMKAVSLAADLVRAKLKEQKTSPPFGVTGVKTFHWTWQQGSFSYNDVLYSGIQFNLTFTVE